MSREIKQFKVGDKAYPRDNSWQIELLSGHHSSLAPRIDKDGVQVEIISEPFKMTVAIKGYLGVEYEFVLVRYEGKVYSTINNFSEKMPPRPRMVSYPL